MSREDVTVSIGDSVTAGQVIGTVGSSVMGHDMSMPVRADVLRQAEKAVCGDRNNQYGPPGQDFERTAELWTTLFKGKLSGDQRFEARDVALAMVSLKLSRLTWQDKEDSWIDVAGYAACGAEVSK